MKTKTHAKSMKSVASKPVITDLHIVTTSRREKLYIYGMVNSLESSGYKGRVAFICGDKDMTYLKRYLKNPNYTIVPWDGTLCDNMRINIRNNQQRAILYNNKGPVFVCEDDIMFKPDWQAKLEKAIKDVPDKHYILDASKPYGSEVKPHKMMNRNLQGSWGIYYSSSKVRKGIAEELTGDMSECSDVEIGMLAKNLFSYWETNAEICWHAGQISTIKPYEVC